MDKEMKKRFVDLEKENNRKAGYIDGKIFPKIDIFKMTPEGRKEYQALVKEFNKIEDRYFGSLFTKDKQEYQDMVYKLTDIEIEFYDPAVRLMELREEDHMYPYYKRTYLQARKRKEIVDIVDQRIKEYHNKHKD